MNPLFQNCRSLVGARSAAILGVAFAVVHSSVAQVSTINSVVVTPRVYDDVPNATLIIVTNYPTLISFTESNEVSSTGYANRDVWHFSADGGNTPYNFQNNDYFTMTMSLKLTGIPITPRKEAGFVFNNPANDGGEFILDTDGHEIVAFGGFLPFYAFPFTGTFQSGQTVTMGITIFKDSAGKNAIIYSANGTNSPALEFGNTEQGVIADTTIGGYMQVVTSATAPNSGEADYSNISIGAPLWIAPSGAQSVIYWSASDTNYVLQSTTNLTSTNWTTVTTGMPIIGVSVPNAGSASFYRLHAQ